MAPNEEQKEDWPKELIPPHPEISIPHLISTAGDQLAALVGNEPSYDALTEKAKKGNQKAFMALIKIHTKVFPFGEDDANEPPFYIPSIHADKEFYSLDWVQERLHEGFKNDQDNYFNKDFWEDFWKACFSNIQGGFVKRSSPLAADRKRYIVLRRDAWNKGLKQNEITIEDIREELILYKLLAETNYPNPDSFRKHLNRYGVKGTPGR